jgi:solute carrier family 35 (adenosine 3'-phospho 5'-phosphosulfate transporter), member B2
MGAESAADTEATSVERAVAGDDHNNNNDATAPAAHWRLPHALAAALPGAGLSACAATIVASMLLYALLQERIMTRPYKVGGGDGGSESFMHSLLLVFANRIAATTVAGAVIVHSGDLRELANAAPLHTFVLVSLSNVVATSCQYEALKWVTLPTQTVVKSAKMIPVMFLGTALFRKRYAVIDYAAAAAVAAGCSAFILFGNIATTTAGKGDSNVGLILMAIYLLFDSFTSTFQEKLFQGYKMSIYISMLYVNFISALISFALLLSSGTLQESITFVIKYPQIFQDIALLSTSAVIGQVAITYTIKNHGALPYATIMTSRQFFTVFISNLVYFHGMNILQWLGAALVFSSLFFRSWFKTSVPKRCNCQGVSEFIKTQQQNRR